MGRVTDRLRRAWRDGSGATAIEYGLLIGLLAAVLIGAWTLVGSNISQTFGTLSNVH